MGRLQGKIALVTGAAAGIGEGIARAFVAEGARVVLSDLRDESGRSVAASIGACAEYLHLDVREEAEWIAVMDRLLQTHGRVDVVVNNAGVTGLEDAAASQDPEHVSLEEFGVR